MNAYCVASERAFLHDSLLLTEQEIKSISDTDSQARQSVSRRRRKTARPGEIVAAAFAEFAEKGYASTRLIDVARRAGIAKGTIYLYFDTKEELFEAAVRAEVVSVLTEVESMIDAFEGASDILLQMFVTKAYRDLMDSHARILMRIIIGEGHLFPELRELYFNTVISRGMRVVDRIVERGIERGEFRDGPVREYPRLVMAPVLMASIWQMSFSEFSAIDVDRYMAAHLDLLLNGLRA